MPAQSKQQQKFMGMVHALKKGEMDPQDASPELKKAAQSMDDKSAKDFAATKHKGLPRKVKQEILNRLKEYANSMGRDHLGGDDYTSSKKGGLRDNDGYDNVDYNPNMKMEAHYTAVANLGTKKAKENLDSFDELQKFMDKMKSRKAISVQVTKISNGKKQTIDYDWDGRNWVSKGKKGVKESNLKGQLAGDSVQDIIKSIGSRFVSGEIKNTKRDGKTYIKLKDEKFGSGVVKILKSRFGIDAKVDYYGGKGKVASSPSVSFFSDSILEGKLPNNWMSGRTSDYHTQLRGKKREYDDTNFEKDNSGQPDLEEAGLKGTENIPSNKKLSKLSDNEKLNILQSSGNIISFHIPDWAKGRYKMWQVISAGKIKKQKDFDGDIIYFLPGKGPQKASPTYKSVKDLINGVDWEKMEMRRESVNESFDKVEHLKLLNLALRTMPGSPKQKEIIRKLNKVRVAGGMKPLKEDLSDVIYQVKKFEKPKDEKLLTIKVINKLKDMRNKSKSSSNKQKLQKMIDKIEGDYKKGKFLTEAPIFHTMNNPRFKKATKDLVKNKKVKNPDTGQDVQLTTALKDKEHPAHKQAKSLFQRLFGEYASKQTLSYLPADEEEIEKMNEGTMIRRAVDIAQELLPKDTWSRFASDGKKNAEFVKNVVRDLTQSLNRFYKNHNISVRIKEEEGDSNVDMVLGVLSILRQIEDKENRQKVAVDMIKKFKEQNIDFDYKEFLELMKEYNK